MADASDREAGDCDKSFVSPECPDLELQVLLVEIMSTNPNSKIIASRPFWLPFPMAYILAIKSR